MASLLRLTRARCHIPTFPLRTARRSPLLLPSRRLNSTSSDNYLHGTSATYVEEMFRSWKNDPSSVHNSWDQFFKSDGQQFETISSDAGLSHESITSSIQDSLRMYLLVRAFQVVGHRIADLDPLKLETRTVPPELTIEYYGFTEADLDREFYVGHFLSGYISGEQSHVTLRDLYDRLNKTYSGTIGVEFMHIQDREQCNWLRSKFETQDQHKYSNEDKLNIYDRLIFGDNFEQFLATKYPATKRFGLEGCESLIPGMKALIDHAAELGVRDVVIGMPHRGRLNVLANVVRRPLEAIFSDFKGKALDDDDSFSGDVKYHLGTSYDRPTRSGKKIHLSLMANPSHLEAVNPVVEGKVRAKQYYQKDEDRSKSLPLLLHGDAAFAAQGVVYECFDLAGLHHYTTGGTVHIIVNNQIGFTTDPKDSRANLYCSDVAKTIEVPIFHVNGDDPEAVVFCMQLAAEWRQKFKKDVVVDIVCYRKYGHNEIDPPDFTQPLMYQKIAQKQSILDIYTEQLMSEGVLTEEKRKGVADHVSNILNHAFENSKTYKSKSGDWLDDRWGGFKTPKEISKIRTTGLPMAKLKEIGKAIYTVPKDFTLHKILVRQMAAKKQMFETGQGIDWATAEALAFGSVLDEGIHVRLSGQDVERGTFSHRHAVLHDQKTEDKYVPLNNISKKQEYYEVTNSSLSEYAVLGFELGYSLENPHSLVLWEAQFGDFANGAQIIIDNFIASGENKWYRQSGIVLLLPHGYEGQGPEHSSARLERFLQMSDSNWNRIPEMEESVRRQIQQTNWQILNCTTPSNYFHALRRQVCRDFRKPLIVMTPKSLLRHKLAVSPLEEFDDEGEDHRFRRVLPEWTPKEIDAPEKIERLVFCSGKVYYDIFEERQKRSVKNTAVVRVEQLSPFPFDLVAEQIAKYPNAKVIWAQEEPANAGAWWFMKFHFATVLENANHNQRDLYYVGRDPAASTATGSAAIHKSQQEKLVQEALVKTFS
eukprot:TRINITY_DN703_c0_g3_i1.p1 TRINITY_DN703_c0_g3~~TRINITY_DN703_c0_g3_i1.p1  ORF type:complete len:987 (+),score=207.75 TRINITY_DN703_c0_g3_i1:44-3004(+)